MFLPSAVAVVLDRTDRRALPVQIADHLRADIRSGKAAVGLRLPSSRKLAAELEVARGVVERAYEQLIAEGWLVAVHGSGTFVAEAPSPPMVTPTTTPKKAADKMSPRVQLRPGVPWTHRVHRQRGGGRGVTSGPNRHLSRIPILRVTTNCVRHYRNYWQEPAECRLNPRES